MGCVYGCDAPQTQPQQLVRSASLAYVCRHGAQRGGLLESSARARQHRGVAGRGDSLYRTHRTSVCVQRFSRMRRALPLTLWMGVRADLFASKVNISLNIVLKRWSRHCTQSENVWLAIWRVIIFILPFLLEMMGTHLIGMLAAAYATPYTPTVRLRNGVAMPLVACGSGGWKDSTAEDGVKVL